MLPHFQINIELLLYLPLFLLFLFCENFVTLYIYVRNCISFEEHEGRRKENRHIFIDFPVLISLFTNPIVKYILFLFVIGPIMNWHAYYFTQLLFKLVKRRNEKYMHLYVFKFGLRISFCVFPKAICCQEIFSIFVYLGISLFYLCFWKVVLLIILFLVNKSYIL